MRVVHKNKRSIHSVDKTVTVHISGKLLPVCETTVGIRGNLCIVDEYLRRVYCVYKSVVVDITEGVVRSFREISVLFVTIYACI